MQPARFLNQSGPRFYSLSLEPFRELGVAGTMKHIRHTTMRIAGTFVAAAILSAGIAFSAMGARGIADTPSARAAIAAEVLPVAVTEAEMMFPDAPDGVDPIVTGPRSAQFRSQQQALDCDRAVWPNVPAGCYPN